MAQEDLPCPRVQTVANLIEALQTDDDVESLPPKSLPSIKPELSSSPLKISKSEPLVHLRCPIQSLYVFKEQIGLGSWGVVHLAIERSSGYLRAVKKIPKGQNADLNRFRQEMTILKGFDHPRIVRLYETFEDYSTLYVVMEYCKGGELFDHLQREGPLPEPVAAWFMRQILSAIAYCHSKNITHRDLKPENFLFAEKDIRSPLKLVDFGLAKRYNKGDVLRSGVGTLFYLAPEVQCKEYDYRVDLWSAGIIFYLMLYGAPPFGGEGVSEVETLRAIRDGNIKYDKRRISPAALDLLRSLCCREVERRMEASTALSHRWFSLQYPSPLCNLSTLLRGWKSHGDLLKPPSDSSPLKIVLSPSAGAKLSHSSNQESPARRKRSEFCCEFSDLGCGHTRHCKKNPDQYAKRRRGSNASRFAHVPTEVEPEVHWICARGNLEKLGLEGPGEASALADKLIAKWRQFASISPLKKAVLSLTAHQLEHTRELAYIRAIFDLLDRGGDGVLTIPECISSILLLKGEVLTEEQQRQTSASFHALNNKSSEHSTDVPSPQLISPQATMQQFPQARELQTLLKHIDLDGDGIIEYCEFAAACLDCSTYNHPAASKAVFRLLDRDMDDRIGATDFKATFGWNAAKEGCSDQDRSLVDQLLVDADLDKDGYIGREDFSALLACKDGDEKDGRSRLYISEDLKICPYGLMQQPTDSLDFSAVTQKMSSPSSHVSSASDAGLALKGGEFSGDVLLELRQCHLRKAQQRLTEVMRAGYI